MAIPLELLSQLLVGLGTGITANQLTQWANSTPQPTPADVESFLRIHGAEAYAPNVIKALVDRGYLTITSSSLYGANGASVAAGAQGQFSISGSRIATGSGSYVHVPQDGGIEGGHGAGVHQGNGDVVFDVGTGGMKVNLGSQNVVVNLGRKR